MKTTIKVIAVVGLALCSACSEKTSIKPQESAVRVEQSPEPEPKNGPDKVFVQTVMPSTHQR